MKCPHCSQKALSFWQIFFFFNGKCSACESFIVLKNPMGLVWFILYALLLGLTLQYFLPDGPYRLLFFMTAGIIVSFGQLKFGELQVVDEENGI